MLLQVHRWNCEACGVGYELGSIESALIAVVQQQERAYQLQDLQCAKCKNVSTSHQVLHLLPSCSFHRMEVLASAFVQRQDVVVSILPSRICSLSCRQGSVSDYPAVHTTICVYT